MLATGSVKLSVSAPGIDGRQQLLRLLGCVTVLYCVLHQYCYDVTELNLVFVFFSIPLLIHVGTLFSGIIHYEFFSRFTFQIRTYTCTLQLLLFFFFVCVSTSISKRFKNIRLTAKYDSKSGERSGIYL